MEESGSVEESGSSGRKKQELGNIGQFLVVLMIFVMVFGGIAGFLFGLSLFFGG